jgi:hypothetical protein
VLIRAIIFMICSAAPASIQPTWPQGRFMILLRPLKSPAFISSIETLKTMKVIVILKSKHAGECLLYAVDPQILLFLVALRQPASSHLDRGKLTWFCFPHYTLQRSYLV